MLFQELQNNILACKFCRERFGFEPHPVFFGNQNAKIVQISQAPSANVHKTLKPFTDMSGKKLKYEWYQIDDDIFYNPNNFFISALSHCYPGKNSSGGDRLPPKICYTKWVKEELKFIDNKLYIIIGAMAASVFFPNVKYNDLIFRNNLLYGKLAIVLPHPSPLNIKWFKDNPEFLNKRISEIRKIIKETLEE